MKVSNNIESKVEIIKDKENYSFFGSILNYDYMIVKFVSEQKWDYDFKNEISCGDLEQSHLSQYIISKLFDFKEYREIDYKDNKTILKYGEDEELILMYDVMNNPKTTKALGCEIRKNCFVSKPTGIKKYKQLKELENEEMKNEKLYKKWLNFFSIYHTIGNFVPIPKLDLNFPSGRRKNINSNIHAIECQERWDKTLKWIKVNYNVCKFPRELSFNDYIIYSYQHLYVKDIFLEFIAESYDSKEKKIKFEKVNWDEKIKEWNKKISEYKEIEIISFNEIDITKVVENIEILIEARGRCMFHMLKKKLD